MEMYGLPDEAASQRYSTASRIAAWLVLLLGIALALVWCGSSYLYFGLARQGCEEVEELCSSYLRYWFVAIQPFIAILGSIGLVCAASGPMIRVREGQFPSGFLKITLATALALLVWLGATFDVLGVAGLVVLPTDVVSAADRRPVF